MKLTKAVIFNAVMMTLFIAMGALCGYAICFWE